MVAHVVLFRPRAGLALDERAALLDAWTQALREIPGIRRARVGRRVTLGRGYEQLMRDDYPFAAMLEFDDAAALERYLQHPVHEALGRRFYEALDGALIYDYEIADSTAGLAGLTSR